MKYLALLSLALIVGCSPTSCDRWEYASFSLTTYSVFENDELKEVDTNALWVTKSGNAFFKNNKLMMKDNLKEMSDFFGSDSNHPMSILSALGKDNWEVYNYEAERPEVNLQTKEWQLRRCI